MVNEKLRKALDNYGKDIEKEFVFLNNVDYDNSIIGFIEKGDYMVAVCSEELMIDELAKELADKAYDKDEPLIEDEYEDVRLEAIEWIEYNTKRALPYMGEKAPVIIEEGMSVLSIMERYGD